MRPKISVCIMAMLFWLLLVSCLSACSAATCRKVSAAATHCHLATLGCSVGDSMPLHEEKKESSAPPAVVTGALSTRAQPRQSCSACCCQEFKPSGTKLFSDPSGTVQEAWVSSLGAPSAIARRLNSCLYVHPNFSWMVVMLPYVFYMHSATTRFSDAAI